jgi:hypothetical protein
MQEVSADKADISADNLHATVEHGATPYNPFKSNVNTKRGDDFEEKGVSLL